MKLVGDAAYGRFDDFEYAYDPIGNRESFKLDGADPATTYETNVVNQYTATSDPSESFDHDDDGNLTQDGTFDYKWDAENRLVAVEPKNPGGQDRKLVFDYDYRSRRVRNSLSLLRSQERELHLLQSLWRMHVTKLRIR